MYLTERCSIVYVHVSRSYDVVHSRMRTSSFPVYKLFCTMQKIRSANKSVRDKISLLLVPLLNITECTTNKSSNFYSAAQRYKGYTAVAVSQHGALIPGRLLYTL